MEGILIFQATGTSGNLKYKYLEVASFGEWRLNAHSRDEWSVHVSGKSQVDLFAARQYGEDLILELQLAPEHKGKWRGRVRVANTDPLILKGLGPMETDEDGN